MATPPKDRESSPEPEETHRFHTPQPQALGPKLLINGGSKLSGHVAISGSKNSALAILAATFCCSGTSKLRNVPDLSDIRNMVSVLGSLGVVIEECDGVMLVHTDGIRSLEPCADAIAKLRGGFFVAGPLLARFGEAVVALPGGCSIGARPVDLYVSGFRALGAVAELSDGKLRARVGNGKRLIGGRFRLDYPSVGATETLMMAACLADGETILSNVAQEPEVINLAEYLISSGANVEGAGTDKLLIRGTTRLYGSVCTIIPDRIEAGTFMLAAAITRSRISMSPVIPCHLSCLIDKLSAAGCIIKQHGTNTLEVIAITGSSKDDIKGFDVKTNPYPGFPTDLQPQTMALLTTCNSLSIVEETVFENRMGFVTELQKLGAKIQIRGSTAFVFGKEKGSGLYGSDVFATDLRGGAALVLAGLAAEGVTEISGFGHIERGYQDLDWKLQSLGAKVRKIIPLKQ